MKEDKLTKLGNRKTIVAKTISEVRQSKEIPIWLVRQTGRSLAEYREAVRNVSNFIEMCYITDLIVKLTLQPITRFNMDEAIIFSDILVVADVLDCDVNFTRCVSPVIRPVEDFKELGSPDEIEAKTLPILKAINVVRSCLPKEKSLIEFAGEGRKQLLRTS